MTQKVHVECVVLDLITILLLCIALSQCGAERVVIEHGPTDPDCESRTEPELKEPEPPKVTQIVDGLELVEFCLNGKRESYVRETK